MKQAERVEILIGDVRERLGSMEAESVDCVVTSPPYWGLRDYGVAGQIGLEPTLGAHLEAMVDVFREVRRVLKPSGVCWVNYGDCYATAPNGRSAADTKALAEDDRTFRDKPFSTVGAIYDANHRKSTSKQRNRQNGTAALGGRVVSGGYLKPKDLCMVPQRLFIALQDDGGWVRSVMPWVKRHGMPESIRDRPANSLEYVAMLTKSERYWYDAEAVRVKASVDTNARVSSKIKVPGGWDTGEGGHGTRHRSGRTVGEYRDRKPGVTPKSADEGSNIKAKGSFHASTTDVLNDRNFRNTDLFYSSVEGSWGLISGADGLPLAIDANPAGFSEAHFATFPPALIEPLIKAGCPAGGMVLDPFGGAGTTGLVAASLGRLATLIELNPEYATLARARIEAAFMGREEGQRHMVKQLGKLDIGAGPLFDTIG